MLVLTLLVQKPNTFSQPNKFKQSWTKFRNQIDFSHHKWRIACFKFVVQDYFHKSSLDVLHVSQEIANHKVDMLE